jgi:lincosamide nucleotidyltransferase A/C/D/E
MTELAPARTAVSKESPQVQAGEVARIYRMLSHHGIQVWLVGGWGIDALLGEQTRPHHDLDVILLLDDVARTRELLACDGYTLKQLWEENRWVADSHGIKTSTAFVLHDAEGLEFDAHAMRLDDQGNGMPAWEAEGRVFRRQDLVGEGRIAGVAVRCITPEMQILCHTGYALPESHLRDVELLHERFGIEYPQGVCR